MVQRPLGISILACLAIISGFLGILTFIFSLFFLTYLPIPESLYLTIITGIISTFIVLISFLIAYGFFNAKRWSWSLGIIVFVIAIISQFITQSFDIYYIVKIIFAVLIYGLVIYYLTRPGVKSYFKVKENESIFNEIKQNKTVIVKNIVIIVIISIILTVPMVWGFIPTDEIEIISISHSPEHPQPGDDITFLAEIKGGMPIFGGGANLCYHPFFDPNKGSISKKSMSSLGNNMYSLTTTKNFKNGTEIWYFVKAGDKLSEERFIQVGHVERSNITTIEINDVIQSPEKVTTTTNSVKISANVNSNVDISSITLVYFRPKLYSIGSAHQEGDRRRQFQTTIDPIMGFQSGEKIFYKIAAKDASNNTAITPTFNFTVS